ncbi:MAG: ArgE/DapE family deacylase [Anaerolineae bacterium]|nr:ArgE/DapE family deacylase [Anaerolineae bacterium]
MRTIDAQIQNWLAQHAEALTETLAALVRIPSLVGQEGPAQAFMRERYEEAGLEVTVFEADRAALADHPAFVDSGIGFAGRPNVIGVWRGGGGGRSLILNGHTDVVSPEPVSEWRYPPFGAQVVPSGRHGRMYGRGTQDMKAGLIANLFAVRALQACGIRLKGDLILQSVIEEEAGGGGGTLACFAQGYRADGFIATEPHWRDVCIAHPGVFYFRIVVPGRSAHAGRAHEGVNAAFEAVPILLMLQAWDRERAERVHFEAFERLDPAVRRSCHLNVGVVRAGDWPSTVPGQATIEGRLSFVPGERAAEVKRELEARLHAVAEQSSWLRDHPPQVTYFGWHTEPWVQDDAHPFVQSFLACLDMLEVVHPKPVLAGTTAGLDTRFASLFGVPALAWGPKGAGLHGVDEYVELDSVLDCARVLAVFAAYWCGVCS